MADLASYGSSERDIEQALVALKKGTQLLKYGRKGKPKFCPFRLSKDESTLIWFSSGEERKLKIASISKIVPGQRTPIFKRNLCPEKDYLSFSLIYDNGEQSLDLICKDKIEAEVWFAGLKALISSGQRGRSKIDGRSDGGLYFDGNVLSSSSPSEISLGNTIDISSQKSSTSVSIESLRRGQSFESATTSVRSDVGIDNTNMQVRGASSDVYRVSVSSAPSSSSQGSAQDDCDALGDVYVWGQILSDASLANGNGRAPRIDLLVPRPLESNILLDVHGVSCGGRHAALVSRQGEVYTWGEESGGRLGHGVGMDASQPRLVESFTAFSVDFVACGEFHTCAVTLAGELFTWGDGTHKAGLLGHGSDVSHWIPKRVCGPLEGIQVAAVSCGAWHTALISSNGQLFTFGDGTFGVLGHGDRASVWFPKEVESLKGLRTIAVACGVWHTAAVVEVIVTQSSASLSSGKLFTWGDGDKNRLGHGDKETRTVPTCVPSLIEYNFHKVACGHSLTVGLTTSGRVFTMGSTVYGQLGNPQSDGKVPCLVEDKLVNESIEEISCGSYHVAALTSRNEVYTWGKGGNGRLGHGDIEDRKSPTLVEALKDRHVKHIACGSNFTAAICLHRWVSANDQSQCSACRQAFGFTRKKHHCYNCGLVHCHSCSSKKALRAALSPNPGKAYRVCDSCYFKLSKIAEGGGNNKKSAVPRLSGENKDRLDRLEIRSSKSDIVEYTDSKASRHGKKPDALSPVVPSQVATLLQLKDISLAGAVARVIPKPSNTPALQSVMNSRAVSPFSRKSSPPRSATPVPTGGGLSFSKSIADGLKRTNELLSQEVQKLRTQVESLRQKCEFQEYELQKSAKKAQEAMSLAAEESAKCKAAKEVIKSLTAQLKDMAERLPPGVYDNDGVRPTYLPNGVEPGTIHHPAVDEENQQLVHANHYQPVEPPTSTGLPGHTQLQGDDRVAINSTNSHLREPENSIMQNGGEKLPLAKSSAGTAREESEPVQNGTKGFIPSLAGSNQVEAEWIEQYEPGVYITLLALRDGTKDIKRVRFSRKRFSERQAETWWKDNREKVFEKYDVRGEEKASVGSSAQT
ncbi:unnamed protein product [Victoria cruziana]